MNSQALIDSIFHLKPTAPSPDSRLAEIRQALSAHQLRKARRLVQQTNKEFGLWPDLQQLSSHLDRLEMLKDAGITGGSFESIFHLNPPKTPLDEWAENIADNYNNGRGSLWGQLKDAHNDLGLDLKAIGGRWSIYNRSDSISVARAKWLLTGKDEPLNESIFHLKTPPSQEQTWDTSSKPGRMKMMHAIGMHNLDVNKALARFKFSELPAHWSSHIRRHWKLTTESIFHLKPLLRIPATIRPDVDVSDVVEFDAAPWFEQASADSIDRVVRDGFQISYSTDNIAEWSARRDKEVQRVLDVVQQSDGGFEVYVDADAATQWIKHHRKMLFQILVRRGQLQP